MPRNSYMEWTEEEILTLQRLYLNDVPPPQIAKVLRRTTRAIELAIKNLLLQEVLHRNTVDVSRKYGLDQYSMYSDLVPYKYYTGPKEESTKGVMVAVGVMYATIVVLSCILLLVNPLA